jgi:hypothetical protein
MQDHAHCYDVTLRKAICEEVNISHLQCRHNTAADMRPCVSLRTPSRLRC